MNNAAKVILPATLAGRCANGYERGQGRVVHGVQCTEREQQFGITAYAQSMCGKTHGARSAGWCSREDLAVTCPRCLKLIAASGLPLVQSHA